MKLPSMRRRGLRPSTMIARLRGRLNLPDVSRPRLARFLAQVPAPVPDLPAGPPKTVAVVVPCYRHAEYLPDALESILRQTRRPDEVILVDDCSPDGTLGLLRHFAAGNPWPDGGPTVLANETNVGQAASLNRAISMAHSDLIMVLNDDDYLMHDAVEMAMSLFARNPEVALIGAGNVGFGGRDSLENTARTSESYASGEPALQIHWPRDVYAYRHGPEFDMTHSACTFHRLSWSAVGGYQTDRRRRVVAYSDRDFQLRVNALWPVGILEGRPLSFWRRDSSVDRGRNS